MSRRDKRGRDAGSAQPRLRGCHRFAGKNPNRKFSLRFGKEETSTKDKKPCLQGFVPSWSFLTRLRRPYLFRLAGKDRGEKGRLVTFGACCILNSGGTQCFSLAFHSVVTLRGFDYAPPDTRVSSLQLVALERLLTIEGADRICWSAPFCGEGFMDLHAPKASPTRGSWQP